MWLWFLKCTIILFLFCFKSSHVFCLIMKESKTFFLNLALKKQTLFQYCDLQRRTKSSYSGECYFWFILPIQFSYGSTLVFFLAKKKESGALTQQKVLLFQWQHLNNTSLLFKQQFFVNKPNFFVFLAVFHYCKLKRHHHNLLTKNTYAYILLDTCFLIRYAKLGICCSHKYR